MSPCDIVMTWLSLIDGILKPNINVFYKRNAELIAVEVINYDIKLGYNGYTCQNGDDKYAINSQDTVKCFVHLR